MKILTIIIVLFSIQTSHGQILCDKVDHLEYYDFGDVQRDFYQEACNLNSEGIDTIILIERFTFGIEHTLWSTHLIWKKSPGNRWDINNTYGYGRFKKNITEYEAENLLTYADSAVINKYRTKDQCTYYCCGGYSARATVRVTIMLQKNVKSFSFREDCYLPAAEYSPQDVFLKLYKYLFYSYVEWFQKQ